MHCSGGAQTKVLHFIDDSLHVVKDKLFETPPLFKLIQQESGTGWKEMYQARTGTLLCACLLVFMCVCVWWGGGVLFVVQHGATACSLVDVSPHTLPFPPDPHHQVFNMGHRLEVYVPSQEVADAIIAISQGLGVDAQVIGASFVVAFWGVCSCCCVFFCWGVRAWVCWWRRPLGMVCVLWKLVCAFVVAFLGVCVCFF